MQPRTIPQNVTGVADEQIHMMRINPQNDEFHDHSFFELVYVTQGSATHYLETEQMGLRQRDYFIIDPGSRHCYQDNRDFEIVNCLFLPEYVDRALVHCPSLSALLSNQVLRVGVPVDIRTADRIFHDESGQVLALIQAMEQEYRQRQTGYAELLRCQLTQVLIAAVRSSDLQQRKHQSHKATIAMAQYLRKHYSEPLSLSAMSEHLGYSTQYLSSLFRRDMGLTLQEYLQRLRIEKALALLDSPMRLSEVAQAVGYSDVKHFIKLFQRYKGITPSTLRRSAR